MKYLFDFFFRNISFLQNVHQKIVPFVSKVVIIIVNFLLDLVIIFIEIKVTVNDMERERFFYLFSKVEKIYNCFTFFFQIFDAVRLPQFTYHNDQPFGKILHRIFC